MTFRLRFASLREGDDPLHLANASLDGALCGSRGKRRPGISRPMDIANFRGGILCRRCERIARRRWPGAFADPAGA